MSSVGKAATGQSLVGRYRILIIGAIVFSAGVAMYAAASTFLSAMSLCENGKLSQFLPNTILTSSCSVTSGIGQDLTFRAVFYAAGRADVIEIPAHVVIRDPDSILLYETQFDDKTIISFMPEKSGIYTATISSLEDENNRIHEGYTRILYGFGFLTEYPDVYNPVGNAFVYMIPLGEIIYFSGIGIIIFGIIKAVRKRKN